MSPTSFDIVNSRNKDTISLVDDVAKEVRSNKRPGLFVVKSANEFIDEAKLRPIPRQLYDLFWFEHEICMLFADSNVGKSIMGVQIGEEVSKTDPVLYVDFELSDKQFEARYSQDYSNHYKFPNNFFRAELNPDDEFDGHESFEEYLEASLEQVIISSGIKVIIIDNITYLRNETDKAKNALPLMKRLKAIKKKHDLSILVLAHTPKRDMTKPLTQNDLGGSKMIMNFCDSAFAIGASQKDSSVRYLKHIKTRNTQAEYHADNVKVYHIVKPENRLFMEFMGFGCEREHLKIVSEKEREDIKLKAIELKAANWSIRDISKELGIAVGTVHKYTKP